jgi:hypothetical protein
MNDLKLSPCDAQLVANEVKLAVKEDRDICESRGMCINLPELAALVEQFHEEEAAYWKAEQDAADEAFRNELFEDDAPASDA